MILLPPNDPRLYQTSLPVDHIAQVLEVLDGVRRAMAEAPHAVAISAPQLGIQLRFFVTTGRFLPSVVINPSIVARSEESGEDREGCLTWPGRWAMVRRSQWIDVRFMNIQGKTKEVRFTGFAARIFQHEIDHLDGVTIFPRPEETT